MSGDDDGQLYVQKSLSDATWRYETTSIYMTDDSIGKYFNPYAELCYSVYSFCHPDSESISSTK